MGAVPRKVDHRIWVRTYEITVYVPSPNKLPLSDMKVRELPHSSSSTVVRTGSLEAASICRRQWRTLDCWPLVRKRFGWNSSAPFNIVAKQKTTLVRCNLMENEWARSFTGPKTPWRGQGLAAHQVEVWICHSDCCWTSLSARWFQVRSLPLDTR